MISNLNSYGSLASKAATTANKSEIDSIIEKHQESVEKNTSTSQTNDSNLYLSSRAQKINAISKEFFSGDALSFNDIDLLKERVYQLGLISKNEYSKFTNPSSETTGQASDSNSSTESVTNFIGGLLERLQKNDSKDEENAPEDSAKSEENKSTALTALIKALESAKDIISNIEEAKRKTDFKATLHDAMSLLKETIAAPTFEKIPLDDKIGLSNVYQTLDIVDKLSPQRLNNEKINRYIDLSFS